VLRFGDVAISSNIEGRLECFARTMGGSCALACGLAQASLAAGTQVALVLAERYVTYH
jgi:hypothetical protein